MGVPMADQLELFAVAAPPPRRGPGRPRRDFTDEEHAAVLAGLREGRAIWEIADSVGCTVPTLRAHFSGRPEWTNRTKPGRRAHS